MNATHQIDQFQPIEYHSSHVKTVYRCAAHTSFVQINQDGIVAVDCTARTQKSDQSILLARVNQRLRCQIMADCCIFCLSKNVSHKICAVFCPGLLCFPFVKVFDSIQSTRCYFVVVRFIYMFSHSLNFARNSRHIHTGNRLKRRQRDRERVKK